MSAATKMRRACWPAAGLALVFLAGCRHHDFPEYPAGYREYAYVSNGGSNSVSVFDVVNIRLDRQLQVGANPTGVTANPRLNEVYVVNSGEGQGNGSGSVGSISVIDTTKNAVVATIPVHRRPYFIDVDPSGDMAYVANSGSNSVSIVDLKARREVGTVTTGDQPGLARVSQDGKSLVVTNRGGNSVSILGGGESGWQTRATLTGCPGATDAVILKDSSKAFVACSGGHQVMVIQLAHGADANSPARPDAVEALMDVGRAPVHLALKPDGGEIFVSNFDSDTISEIETGTDDVSGAYIMGSHPVRGLVSADNTLLYVSNFQSQELSVYSIDDGKRIGLPVHTGDGPDGLAFSASGTLLFAVDARSGDVAVIRTSDRSLFTLLPSGRSPNAIAVKAFSMH